MQSPKISIVITAYNIEPYIGRCLESVVNQTLEELQIIVVEDKSTDGTLEIIRHFARKDPRIELLENEKNRGQALSNISGVKKAKGEYIYHLDGDDYLSEDAMESLYRRITEEKADMAFMDAEFVSANDKQSFVRKNFEQDSIEPLELLKRMLTGHSHWTMWSYIYNKKLAGQIDWSLPEKVGTGNDLVVTFQLVHQARKIVKIQKTGIFYYIREDSMSHTKTLSDKKYRSIEFYADLMGAFLKSLPEYGQIKKETATFQAGAYLLPMGTFHRYDQAQRLSRKALRIVVRYPSIRKNLQRRWLKAAAAFAFSKHLGEHVLTRYIRKGKI